jgi:protoheme IX farnesyltransferase
LVGFSAGGAGAIDRIVLLHALVGTALVAGGANALNQIIERHRDALMVRTRNRPLPSGRLSVSVATRFAVGISTVGLIELLLGVNLLTAFLGALALAGYAFVYTPLKTVTIHNTLVGAAVGALPPLMGWTAATGELGDGGWVLFAILFVWQLPHFFAIAWMHRDDYIRGGYRMLSVIDESGKLTRRQIAILAALLIPLGLLPVVLGQAGGYYAVVSVVLGAAFFAVCVWGSRANQDACARRSFVASIIYLPCLLAMYLADKL